MAADAVRDAIGVHRDCEIKEKRVLKNYRILILIYKRLGQGLIDVEYAKGHVKAADSEGT